MAVSAENLYTAPHIGTVDQRTRDLYVNFLSHKGPERTSDLFRDPYFRQFFSSPVRAGLVRLDTALAGFPDCLPTLEEDIKKQWEIWRDSTLHVLGDEFLAFFYEDGQRRFVSNLDLYSTARRLARSNSATLKLDPENLRTGDSGIYPVFPDSIVVVEMDGRMAATDFFDYRISTPSKRDRNYMNRFVSMAETFTHPDTRQLLRDITRELLGGRDLDIPLAEQHPGVKVVTAVKNHTAENYHDTIAQAEGWSLYADNNWSMDIRINPLAYFVLQQQVGNLPTLMPEQYFQPLE